MKREITYSAFWMKLTWSEVVKYFIPDFQLSEPISVYCHIQVAAKTINFSSNNANSQ